MKELPPVRGSGGTAAPAAPGYGAAALWASAGVIIIFASAALRLGMRGAATIRAGLEPLEWVALVVLTAGFVYGEGVRALQRKYVPHVFLRIEQLRHAAVGYRLLAPLYAMSLIGAPRAHMAAAWAGTLAIVAAVVIISRLPEPWRGVVDFAVAAALAWATVVVLFRAARGHTH